MFNNFGDRFEKPTVCQIIAAICDPRTTRPFWCDVFEKVTYRAHTIDVIEILALFARVTMVMQGDNFITNTMMTMLGTQINVFCLLKATTLSLPPHV